MFIFSRLILIRVKFEDIPYAVRAFILTGYNFHYVNFTNEVLLF